MRREVYGRLQRLPVHYFDQRASREQMTRVVEDVNSVTRRILIDGIEQGSADRAEPAGRADFSISHEPLACRSWRCFPCRCWQVARCRYCVLTHRRYRAFNGRLPAPPDALLMDNLQGVRQIKSFGRESHEDSRFEGRANELRSSTPGHHENIGDVFARDEFCRGAGAVLIFVG